MSGACKSSSTDSDDMDAGLEANASDGLKAKPSLGEKNMIKLIHITPNMFTSEILNSELPVVVELHFGTCRKCNNLTRIAKTLADEFDGVIKFAEVNLEESPELDTFFDSADLPALVMVDHAKHKGEFLGELTEDEVRSHLQKWISAYAEAGIRERVE